MFKFVMILLMLGCGIEIIRFIRIMFGAVMNRNLDGVYFRVKRNNTWQDICFSDLTENERNEVMKDRSVKWLQSLCNILANKLKDIGDQFNLVCE